MFLIRKSKLINISFISIGLFLILEIICRLILGLGTPPLYEEHPTIEYLLKPNQKLKRFHNNITINSLGMRSDEFLNPKNNSLTRVLIFGDSVLWGGSRLDQKFIASEILKEKLNSNGRNYEVGNISAGGWGPGNWLEYVKEKGLHDADDVILVISSHDSSDNPVYNSLKNNHLNG